MAEQLSSDEFAARFKEKFPAYADMPNSELTKSVIEKHPEYADMLKPEPTYIEQAGATLGKGVEALKTPAKAAAQPFIEAGKAVATPTTSIPSGLEKAGQISQVATSQPLPWTKGVNKWEQEDVAPLAENVEAALRRRGIPGAKYAGAAAGTAKRLGQVASEFTVPKTSGDLLAMEAFGVLGAGAIENIAAAKSLSPAERLYIGGAYDKSIPEALRFAGRKGIPTPTPSPASGAAAGAFSRRLFPEQDPNRLIGQEQRGFTQRQYHPWEEVPPRQIPYQSPEQAARLPGPEIPKQLGYTGQEGPGGFTNPLPKTGFSPQFGDVSLVPRPEAQTALERRVGIQGQMPRETVSTGPSLPSGAGAAKTITKKETESLYINMSDTIKDPAKVARLVEGVKADKLSPARTQSVMMRLSSLYQRSFRLAGPEAPETLAIKQHLENLGIKPIEPMIEPVKISEVKPAIRDPQTGEVHVGEVTDKHADIAAKAPDPATQERLANTIPESTGDSGFMDENGKFLSRSEAKEKYGFATSEEMRQAQGVPEKAPEAGPSEADIDALHAEKRAEDQEYYARQGGKTPVSDTVRSMGGLSEKSAAPHMGELGPDTKIRGLFKDNGATMDQVAHQLYAEGKIPDESPATVMEALKHESETGTPFYTPRGASPEGFREGWSAGSVSPQSPVWGGKRSASTQKMFDEYDKGIRSMSEKTQTTAQRMGQGIHKVYKEILNSETDLENLRKAYKGQIAQDKDLALLLSRQRGVGGIAEANLMVGTHKLMPNGDLVKTGEPLSDILKQAAKLGKTGFQDLERYLVAWRDKELSIKKVTVPGQKLQQAGVLGTPGQLNADSIIAELNRQYGPVLDDLAKRYKDWEDRAFLQPYLDLGIKTPKEIEDIRASGREYVAFARYFDEIEKSGMVSGSNPLKRMSGSERDIVHPFETVLKQNQAFTKYFEQERIRQSIYAMKDGLPEMVKEVKVSGPDTISTFINGEVKHLKVSPEVKKALEYKPHETDTWLKVAKWPAQWQRAGVTLDPRFSLFTHPFKYQAEAFLLSNTKRPFIPVWDYARGFGGMLGQGKKNYYDMWMAAGGDQTSMVALDLDEYPKKLEEILGYKKASDYSIIKGLQKLRKWDDQAVRIGIFRQALDEGKSHIQAAQIAREGVVDPGRRGSSDFLNKLASTSPFFNIHAQSSERLRQELIKHPQRFAARMAGMIAFTAGLWWRNKDDPRYTEKPPMTRYSTWTFLPVHDSKDGGYQIPKPFVPGNIASAVEAILDTAYHDDPEAITKWFEETMGALVPLPIPAAIKPAIELQSGPGGHVYHTGKPIVPGYKQRLNPSEQSTEATSSLAKYIGKDVPEMLPNALQKRLGIERGVSPAKIDYFMKYYGSTLGKRALAGLEGGLRSKGLIGKGEIPPIDKPFSFAAPEPLGSLSESLTRFRDYGQKLNQDYATVKEQMHGIKPPSGGFLGMFSLANKQLREIDQNIQKIKESPTMPNETKFVRVQDMQRLQTKIAHQVVQAYEKAGRPTMIEMLKLRKGNQEAVEPDLDYDNPPAQEEPPLTQ